VKGGGGFVLCCAHCLLLKPQTPGPSPRPWAGARAIFNKNLKKPMCVLSFEVFMGPGPWAQPVHPHSHGIWHVVFTGYRLSALVTTARAALVRA
jgi:hypothetical protein